MFKLLKKIKAFVSGYKTYIVCVTTIAGLVVAFSEGTITAVEFYQGVMLALAGITIAAKINRGNPA